MLKKQWLIDFAGVLATEDEVYRYNVFVNNQGTLQFYLKLISVPPENFVMDAQAITCFADDIDYPDTPSEDEKVRVEKLTDFLGKYIFFFNIDVVAKGTENYYRARNITYVKKNDEFMREESLNQIPIFSGDTEQVNRAAFETKLLNNRFVGDNKNISNDDDDTPNIICWKDPITEEISLYGLFDSHDYAHGGFRFKFSNGRLKKLSLREDTFLNYYENRHVLYLPLSVYQQIETDLNNHGESLINEETKQEIKSSTVTTVVENKLEAIFMEAFEQKCISQGLFYDRKDLYNFHTAMKTGNLVVLAGMSGTGKSKLVQCYAETLELKKEQLLFIPVRPYWQDDADVIGYLDVLNNVYRPGDSGLVNILIHAYTNPDQMHIVCFDEMNIARVEHYFSQFLSVLEMDENKRILRLYNDELQFRIYNNSQYEPIIKIGNNVLFVGTVNLDESTYQFSDKVLDRANVINLSVLPYADIENLIQVSEFKTEKDKLDITTTLYNQFRNKDTKGLTKEEATCLWRIHEELQQINRNLGVGWRIVKQIGNYLNNLPENTILSREEAFDLQLVQRVLTKIRGTEEQFKELIGKYDLDTKTVNDSVLLDDILSKMNGYSMSKTRQIIIDKSRELKLYGYTI